MSNDCQVVRNNTGHIFILDKGKGTITVTDDSGNLITIDARNKSLVVSVEEEVSITVEKGMAVISAAGGVSISSSKGITISAAEGVTIDGSLIRIGSEEAAPLVKDSIIDVFNSHRHDVPGGTQTSVPKEPANKEASSTSVLKGQ
jgi:hypothetical protein